MGAGVPGGRGEVGGESQGDAETSRRVWFFSNRTSVSKKKKGLKGLVEKSCLVFTGGREVTKA